MNILIYIPFITKKDGGIYQYSIGLLNTLKLNTLHTFHILYDKNDKEIYTIVSSCPNFKAVDFDIKNLNFWGSKTNRVLKKLNQRFPIFLFKPKSHIESIIKTNSIDIVHCPFQYYLNTGTTPFVSTMHDVQELHYPDFFNSSQREQRAILHRKAVENSDKVVVSYQHIKDDLVNFFEVDSNKINVILLNMSKLWIDAFNDEDIIEKDKLDIPENFILYPAATWKHKNHKFLLKALCELKSEGKDINVVFTGHLTDYYEDLRSFIKNNDLDKQCVFKGIVSDQELFSLYKHALGVVIPTLYEAGSFPLYESILTNVPVVCSNSTSLPETIDNEELVFDTESTDRLKTLLLKMYFEPTFRSATKSHLKLRSEQIRDNNAVENFNTLYKQLI